MDLKIAESLANQLYAKRMRKRRRNLIRSRWVHRIRKHGNLISVVAISFALTSSALKEHFSEEFKDQLSTLEKAYDRDQLRNAVVTITQEVRGISGNFRTWPSDFDAHVAWAALHVTDLAQMLEQEEAEMFPLWEELEHDHGVIRDKKFNSLVETIGSFLPTPSTLGWMHDKNSSEYKSQVFIDEARGIGIQADVSTFLSELRWRLNEKLKVARERSDTLSTINLFVFPIGILLAVLGQVAKVKTASGD